MGAHLVVIARALNGALGLGFRCDLLGLEGGLPPPQLAVVVHASILPSTATPSPSKDGATTLPVLGSGASGSRSGAPARSICLLPGVAERRIRRTVAFKPSQE